MSTSIHDMPKNYQSHKRQKSSLLNVGYYFQDQPSSHSPNRSLNQLDKPPELSSPILSTNLSHPMSSPTHSNPQSTNSPTMDQSIYDQELYNPLNFNYPQQDRPSVFYSMPPSYVMELNPYSLNQNFLPPPSSAPPGPIPLGSIPNTNISASPTYSFPQNLPTNPRLGYSNPISQPHIHQPQSLPQGQPQTPISQHTQPLLPHTVPVPSSGSSSQIKPTTPGPLQRPLRGSPSRRHSRRRSQVLSISSTPKQDISQHSKPALTLPRHKANLSISSHFNLFSLTEPEGKLPNFNKDALFSELVLGLADVDSPSMYNYLLKVLNTLDNPIPIDDFFNLLYNDQKSLVNNKNDKIDKTNVTPNLLQTCVDILNRILEIFKNPDTVYDHLSRSKISKEVKLTNINYHELLRTFLAIKILQDMLIELPKDSPEVTNFNIPRLSLYKTYFIICQKLLLKYPSSLNSSNEHHKLILGQSKLGKLIKVVYPNLIIKRLGSRGESKYNYLGVVWNENIIDEQMATLCNNYELEDLNQIFKAKYKQKFKSLIDIKEDIDPGPSISPPTNQEESIDDANAYNVDFNKPIYSYLNNSLKFPANFDVITWVRKTQLEILSDFSLPIDKLLDELIDEESEQLDFGNGLISRINQVGLNLASNNNELKLFLLILLQVFPKLLLFEPTTNLRALKQNLKRFLDQDVPNFNEKNLTNFKLLLKNLLSLSDLLINLVKFVFKNNLILNDLNHVFDNNDHEDLVNNLVDSMIIFNMADSLDYTFLNENTNNIKDFFTLTLPKFFEEIQINSMDRTSTVKIEESNLGFGNFDESITIQLTEDEFTNLIQFFNLIKDGLINRFHQFPILMMINFFNLVSNDFLKSVYFKHVNSSLDTSFSHWWSINCFLQDYVGVVGELYALYNDLYRIL